MNINIGYKLLERLNEKDIETIASEANIKELLKPIQQNPKHFSNENSLRGIRFDEKSELARKKIPNIAIKLYNQGDHYYYDFFARRAHFLRDIFKNIIEKRMNKKVEDVAEFEDNDYEKLFTIILNTKGMSLNLDTFFLQAKLFDIQYSDDSKQKIGRIGDKVQLYKKAKKEVEKEYQSKSEERIKAIGTKLHKQILVLKRELKDSKDNGDELSKIVSEQTKKIEKLNEEIQDFEQKCKSKESRIAMDLEEYKKLQHDKEKIEEKLNKITNEYFAKLQLEWENKNKKSQTEYQTLISNIKDRNKEVEKLDKEISTLKNTVESWDKQIDKYYEHIDEKIINHRIDSQLLGNLTYQQIAQTGKTKNNTYSGVFLLDGFIPSKQNIFICQDYQDYISRADDNIDIIGKIKDSDSIVNMFSCAIMANLIPLFCGYGSVDVATALAAAAFGEKPTIISIEPGFNNITVLKELINNSHTRSIIIADVFGKMNESVLVPILRMHLSKNLIFVAEGIEDIKFLPDYIYNYVQLIYFECEKLNQEYELVFSTIAEFDFDANVNEKGYKSYLSLLKYMDIKVNYINRRKSVINILLSDEYGVEENEGLLSLVTTELKWIIEPEQWGKLIEYLQAHSDKYSSQIIERLTNDE